PPAPPSRFRSGLSRELELVVLRALAKNPSHRFASAAQFAEHLSAAMRSSQLYIEEVRVEPDETVETRARNPVVIADELTGIQPASVFDGDEQFTGVQPKPVFDALQFYSPKPVFDAPQFYSPEPVDEAPPFNSPGPVENLEVRPPALLIER